MPTAPGGLAGHRAPGPRPHPLPDPLSRPDAPPSPHVDIGRRGGGTWVNFGNDDDRDQARRADDGARVDGCEGPRAARRLHGEARAARTRTGVLVSAGRARSLRLTTTTRIGLSPPTQAEPKLPPPTGGAHLASGVGWILDGYNGTHARRNQRVRPRDRTEAQRRKNAAHRGARRDRRPVRP